MMKRKRMAPRNPFVAAAKFRKAGKHDKAEKALRRAARMEVQRGFGRVARQQAFNLYDVSSILTGPTSFTTKADHGLFSLCSSLVVQRQNARLLIAMSVVRPHLGEPDFKGV